MASAWLRRLRVAALCSAETKLGITFSKDGRPKMKKTQIVATAFLLSLGFAGLALAQSGEKANTIWGQVRDTSAGLGAPGVVLTLRHLDSWKAVASTVTDRDGRYALSRLPENGRFRLMLDGGGTIYMSGEKVVDAPGRSGKEVDWTVSDLNPAIPLLN
jgi:5-hydroxyisourate hydrolase-like protein (transthyretin family)